MLLFYNLEQISHFQNPKNFLKNSTCLSFENEIRAQNSEKTNFQKIKIVVFFYNPAQISHFQNPKKNVEKFNLFEV